ncbi:hypothetical protein E1A91_A09G233200v1 [Gossypium mustelinum]|uniref:Uncharacterized protein n=2 Tax=Gossypium TaxID=3633 RepID=A0ABR0NUB8_GOSAR|nr:uncharacterized protein LOC108455833 [Gossypium arboreum]KAK5804955.1 hypothetical protein PVK06_032607 [Gossypium arboreum]TYJ20035.1 hypothetical protein E1A91_A09G233200v1 [Gossypium mustelinum]
MAMEAVQASSRNSMETNSSPRISFSADFLDETNFISINPHSQTGDADKDKDKTAAARVAVADFEFLSSNVSSHAMLTADELFFEGKLLPFWQMHHSEKLKQINLRKESGGDGEGDDDDDEREVVENKEESSRVSWFVDDDPSPRPPKCTVLWKELLRLKKQRATSSLSPSSSSSSSSSSSLADVAEEGKQGSGNRDNKHVKRIKKGLERTRSASIRIRPMINVPICTQVKSSALPPLFPLKKGRILER